jgi:predicted lipid-binding transport protein (Tim44 family)
MTHFRFRPLLALCAIAATLLVAVGDADARAGRGGSFGSRGSQTFSAPPSTATSQGARPIERSMTQPGQAGTNAARPSAAAPGGSFFNRPGFMGGGFLGGMFAGFLGAGLLGMLFGHGLTGGLGGAGSMIGLLLQIGIIAVVAYLLWTWWQRRSQPAMASGPGFNAYNSGNSVPPNSHASFGFGGFGGGGAPAEAQQRPPGTDEVGLTPEDFNTFERMLGEVEAAYSAEDLVKLRRLGTPELVSYLSEDLSENASKGIGNKISDVKLMQGDLAEAWREGDKDYATVAMRYALNDQTVDRNNGRVLDGGPTEAKETWTFMRAKGGNWLLSAIQQG